MKISKSRYLKAAKLYVNGATQTDALVKAGVMNLHSAQKQGYMVFNRDYMISEIERLREIEDNEFRLSKAEKLEQNAILMRGLHKKLKGQIEGEEDIDNKAIDSFVKLGKRDDHLQGHLVMAETNPQDKADKALIDWVMEIHKEGEQSTDIRLADVVDIESEVVDEEEGHDDSAAE